MLSGSRHAKFDAEKLQVSTGEIDFLQNCIDNEPNENYKK